MLILGLILGGVVLLLFAGYQYINRNKDYWVERGVKSLRPKQGGLIGILYVILRKKNVIDFDLEYYEQIRADRFGGVVDFGVPSLLVKDPDLVRQILVKDFDHFVDRRKMKLESEPILNLMLTSLEGQEWKNVRSLVSPTFTTGKIRRMFEHFNECSEQLVDFVKTKPVGAPKSRDIVVKEAISRYLVDVIGSTAFGMSTNSLKDPNSIFYKMSKRSSDFSMLKLIRIILLMIMPFLSKLGVRFTDNESMDFFEQILRKALKNRDSAVEKREDFLQLLIEARKGELKTDDSELEAFEKDAQLSQPGETSGKPKTNLTDDIIVAQSLLFFLAGLDTTGTLLCFAFYLLALNQDIQDKLHKEVNKVMQANNGKVTYDEIVHMEYMEKFVSEILRMYPPGTRVERRCTKPYTVPNTNITLDKDSLVGVSVLGIHHDPEFYPEPKKFDPERFTPEAKAARHPYTYLPFGQGPRNCIGMRFALMEAKVALAYLVYHFSVEPCATTPVPLKLDPNLGARPIPDLELRFKERQLIRLEE